MDGRGAVPSFNPNALFAELNATQARKDATSLQRRITILETLLARPSFDDSDEMQALRGQLCDDLAGTLGAVWGLGIFSPDRAADVLDRAHALYGEALEISHRLQREVEVAATAQNRANLYLAQFRAGIPGAAEAAHALYDEALEIRRRLGPEVDVAMTAQNRANLYLAQFRAGVPGAAEAAHALFGEALEIFRASP